jgi:flagellar biogenesis protein FliO
MRHRGNIRGRFLLLGVFLGVSALAVSAQGPESEDTSAIPEPDEYSEYESIPAPTIKLESDVFPEDSEEPAEEPTDEEAVSAIPQEDEVATESKPDPFISEVYRELDARRGGGVNIAGEVEDREESDSTSYNVLKAFGWLLVVIALILLIYYVLQRRSGSGKLLTGNRLGTVLGRLYLSPRVCLYFVRTGGKVLVIGQSQNGLSLIAGFGEADFASVGEESYGGERQEEGETATTAGRSFFSELRANLTQMNRPLEVESGEPSPSSIDEDDIAALRGDIHRLQEYLRDSTRESER